MSGRIPPFRERLDAALASESLPIALDRSLGVFRERRLAAFANDDFSAIQKELYALKADAIERLPELIEQFVREAEAVGTVVHRAATIGEAQRIVGDIARRHNVKLAVKSKSMVTEEIQLNEFLEAQGVKVVETDLGEWIVQIAHDRPSHLIAPAIHWTREQVAELFSKHVGRELPAIPEALVAVAREQLRQAFMTADMGISGANIGIASTGTIVLVSNEGNARLTTTLPPVTVAILGPEKIVPTLDDATAILKVLARNATGQKFSTYVSMTTGPSRTADIELTLTTGVHGPKEAHIILLDNGRMAARDDPDMREALHCIKCGACANVCPPYSVVGGHAFGHIYTGPIGLVLTAIHFGVEEAGLPQSLCAACNTCETVCPVGIPIPRQIIDVRQRYVEKRGLALKKRALITGLTSEAAQEIGKLGQAPFVGDNDFIRHLPFAAGLTSWRSLPALAKQPLRARLSHLTDEFVEPRRPTVAGSQAAGLRVVYFPGCLTDRLKPATGEAAVKVLQAVGCRTRLASGWQCCGLVASNAGDRVWAKKLARQTITTLEEAGGDWVVSTSTSCTAMIAQDYLHLFRDEPEWQKRAAALAGRVMDFTHFMDQEVQLPPGSLAWNGRDRVTTTYHDPCQSTNCLGLKDEGRRLLRDVAGMDLVEMADSTVCCGFGGSFSIDHPRVAKRLLRTKLNNAVATGAGCLAADNAGCLMHLAGGVDAAGLPMRTAHLADLLAERLPE